jgi:2-amino-4-hydroxy-6-hydroxymethyldihydropteridine diphosphokinase
VQTAYLALGANLGERLEALRGGRKALHGADGVQVDASSPLYETEPVGGPERQGLYLNAVLRVRTKLPPRELLTLCLEVEKRFGRRRDERWGARTLDIDILFYERVVLQESDLTLPHPRLHERPFVLLPLFDLEPDLVHPLMGVTLGELVASLTPPAGVCRKNLEW